MKHTHSNDRDDSVETSNSENENQSINPKAISRRSLLAGSAVAATIGAQLSQKAHAGLFYQQPQQGFYVPPAAAGSGSHPIYGGRRNLRRSAAMRVRINAAREYFYDPLAIQVTNGDEGLHSDYRASFTKALPHDGNGDVNTAAYQQLLAGLKSGLMSDLELVQLGGQRKLANPLGAYKFELTGHDSHTTWMRPAPVFAGDETSAEMGELYWKALCRDVPFADYGTDPLIAAAVSDLNSFTHAIGPEPVLTTDNIFRGETTGDLTGPYISQFLVKDIPFGNTTITQSYVTPGPGDDYMTGKPDWLAIQNGFAPAPLVKGNPRYISDARALGEFVHQDFSYQSYLSAALIMLGIPGSFDDSNVYGSSITQGNFVSLGGPDVLDLVAKAAELSLTGAWYQKWLVHRRARPEVYGGRLQNQLLAVKDYGLPGEIGMSDGVGRTYTNNGSYYLPMAFPEGSPTHPSYPAGHATIAGACATVLKAYFKEDLPIPNPVEPDPSGTVLLGYGGTLTMGDEINKLANNIALGRDWAGVHYRSDGVDGLYVGEYQAIGMLRDYSRTYREMFSGFTLTKFDGTQIQIADGVVTTLP